MGNAKGIGLFVAWVGTLSSFLSGVVLYPSVLLPFLGETELEYE